MNLSPLLTSSFVIQLHVYAAVAAIVLGPFILLRRKGTPAHKLAGRIWVVLMVVVAGSSLFIHTLFVWGNYSPIHLLSVYTLVSLGIAIHAVRTGNITRHEKTMKMTYLLALIVTGFFTLLPGRLMHEVLLEPVQTTGSFTGVLIVAAFGVLAIYLIWRLVSKPHFFRRT